MPAGEAADVASDRLHVGTWMAQNDRAGTRRHPGMRALARVAVQHGHGGVSDDPALPQPSQTARRLARTCPEASAAASWSMPRMGLRWARGETQSASVRRLETARGMIPPFVAARTTARTV